MTTRRVLLYLVPLVLIGVFPLLTAHAVIVPACEGTTCNFNDFIDLAKNIMSFLIKIAIPIFAVLFAWAGFLYLTSGGSEGKIKKAHGIITTAIVGFIVAIAAYLIVNLLTTFFLKKDANDPFKGGRNIDIYEIV